LGEDWGAVFYGFAEGGYDGGYDVVDHGRGAVAGCYAHDVAFDEGVVGIAD
jgi:hypothetical protein